MKYLIILWTSVILSSCCQKNKDIVDGEKKITFEEFVYQQSGKSTEIYYNKDKDYALTYVKMPLKQGNTMPTLNINVYNVSKRTSIYKTSLVRGSVKWVSNSELRLTSLPGMVSRDEPTNNSYIYNVITKHRSDSK